MNTGKNIYVCLVGNKNDKEKVVSTELGMKLA